MNKSPVSQPSRAGRYIKAVLVPRCYRPQFLLASIYTNRTIPNAVILAVRRDETRTRRGARSLRGGRHARVRQWQCSLHSAYLPI